MENLHEIARQARPMGASEICHPILHLRERTT
jgi:hypothetical protein